MDSRVPLCLALIFLTGCATAVPVFIRRSVVSDDVVYVKSNNTLYKRYIHKGMKRVGNKDLMDKAEGPIGYTNENITIFKDYTTAKQKLNGYALDMSLLEDDKKSKETEDVETTGNVGNRNHSVRRNYRVRESDAKDE